MNARRGFADKLAWLGLAALLALGCSSDKKTLLLLDVSLQPDLAAPTSVTVDVSAAGVAVGSEDFAWAEAKNGILRVGAYLPDGVSGLISVTATGKTDGVAQSRASKDANVLADRTNGPVSLTLNAIEVVGDAGIDAGADASPALSDAADGSDGAGRLPDAAPNSEDGGSDISKDDAGAVALNDGGKDASVADAPAPDANSGVVDAPVGDVQGDAASAAGDLGSDASGGLAWEPAHNVENDLVSRSLHPVIAIEPITENVFVAWYESNRVKVTRYDRQAGTWGAVKVIENRGLPAQVAIGTDASGHIMVAWVQESDGTDSSLFGVWTSQSSDGVAWSPPQMVASGSVYSLQLAMARNGIARLAWTRKTGTNQIGLFTATFDKTSWVVNPSPVLDPNSPEITDPYDPNPQLAIGGTGDGILVFDVYDPNNNTSVGAVTLTGTTRSALRILDSNTTDNIYADNRSVAMNANGEGVVVWAENSSSSAALNLAYYKPASSWTSVQKVTDGDEFFTLGSALDNNGNITVAWVQGFATSGHNVMAIHGKVGGVWSESTALETDNKAAGNYNEFAAPMLAVDGIGNVLAVWKKKIDANTYGAYGCRLQGATWQTPVKLGQKTDLKTLWPRVAVADSGFGAAAFAFYSSTGTTSDSDAYNAEVAFCR
jgi:hypothetical protein